MVSSNNGCHLLLCVSPFDNEACYLASDRQFEFVFRIQMQTEIGKYVTVALNYIIIICPRLRLAFSVSRSF